MDEKVSLLNKRADDLTVGDSLKVMAIATAVSIAVPVVFLSGVAVAGKIKDKLAQRKQTKTNLTVVTDE